MSKITQLREQLASAVNELPGETTVTLGPTEYASHEAMFVIQKTIGDNTPENQQVMDDLYEAVPDAFKLVPELSNITHVSRCSGHRLYSLYPGAPIQLGCEWTVKVLS